MLNLLLARLKGPPEQYTTPPTSAALLLVKVLLVIEDSDSEADIKSLSIATINESAIGNNK